MQLQPTSHEKKKSKGKKSMSMSQDTGMSLDYELELDESLFEKDNFTRPRSKSEDRVIDRRRHSSEEPKIGLDSDLRNSTITENDEEEQKEIEADENPGELEPNEAIASLLMSLAVEPVTQDKGNLSDLSQDKNTTVDTPLEEDPENHTADNEVQVSSEQLVPDNSQTETDPSSNSLVEDRHSHTASASNLEENAESLRTTNETGEQSSVTLSAEQNSAVALSGVDSMTEIEAQDSTQEMKKQDPIPEIESQNSTSTIKGEDSSLELKGQGSLTEVKSQESLNGQDSISERSDENVASETNDQDPSEIVESDYSTPEIDAQSSSSEIKVRESTVVMKGREMFSSSRQEPFHRPQDTRITAGSGARVAELREKFLGFTGTQKKSNFRQLPPQRYSRQLHALQNGTSDHEVETASEKPQLSNQNHTEMEQIVEVDSEQDNSDRDGEEVDINGDEEMLSASRPNLDLTGSEVLLRVPKLTNSSLMKRLSPLALYSRSMSDAETSSQTKPDQDSDDNTSNSSTEQRALGDEFNSTPPMHIITRPQWLANQEAEDELSSGESESDLIQPLTPFSGQSNTNNHIQTNGQMHNSPNNLYHLAAKKKAQQRVSEAMVANTLSSAGRAQVTALTSIPEEY